MIENSCFSSEFFEDFIDYFSKNYNSTLFFLSILLTINWTFLLAKFYSLYLVSFYGALLVSIYANFLSVTLRTDWIYLRWFVRRKCSDTTGVWLGDEPVLLKLFTKILLKMQVLNKLNSWRYFFSCSMVSSENV